jgi:hypothetical protein
MIVDNRTPFATYPLSVPFRSLRHPVHNLAPPPNYYTSSPVLPVTPPLYIYERQYSTDTVTVT